MKLNFNDTSYFLQIYWILAGGVMARFDRPLTMKTMRRQLCDDSRRLTNFTRNRSTATYMFS